VLRPGVRRCARAGDAGPGAVIGPNDRQPAR
jgi:hypothetical protein